MKRNRLLGSVAVLSLFAMGAQAQSAYPPSNEPPPPPAAGPPTLYAPPQLDQMLAPIALYPDPLLTEVLTGATYPDEIDQAAQWAAQNPGLSGPQLATTVEGQDWDPSVKSLTPFPQILGMMDQHIDWTQQIGGAFMAQQPDVMDSIQRLRQQAYSAGALRSSPYESVVLSGDYIEIQPANAQVVYVPTYDPRRVYGNWAYGAYPPDYWGPPPGLQPRYEAGLLGFGVGIGVVGALWHWGDWDWAHHDVRVDQSRYNIIIAGHGRPAEAANWHHDASRPSNFARGEQTRPGEARPGAARRADRAAAGGASTGRTGSSRRGAAWREAAGAPAGGASASEQARTGRRRGPARRGVRPPSRSRRRVRPSRPGPEEAAPPRVPRGAAAGGAPSRSGPREPPRPAGSCRPEARPEARPAPQQAAHPPEARPVQQQAARPPVEPARPAPAAAARPAPPPRPPPRSSGACAPGARGRTRRPGGEGRAGQAGGREERRQEGIVRHEIA